MGPLQIVIIALLATSIGFLSYFVIKSFVAPKRIDTIQKYIKQGKITAAIKLAKAIIAKDSRDYIAHYWLGEAYLSDNKPELALMEFKFVNQNALFGEGITEVTFRKKIAQLYSRFNQQEDALKEYLLLTKLEPRNADNYYEAGKIFEEKNKSDQALAYYQQTLKYNKRNVKAHAAMGLLLYRAKQFAEAKKEIDIAIQLSPDTFSSYYYLGKILKEGKDYAAAINAFEKALRDPDYKQKSLIERGSCYASADNIEKAIIEFDRAVKASQNDSSNETLYARYFLATCYEKNRDIDKAIIQWEAINSKKQNFKDVPAKLSQYKDIQSNDFMKEYLTCNAENFVEICKKAALLGLNLNAQAVESKKFGCIMTATEVKKDNWMSVRQQAFLVLFYREPELIEDSVVRKLLDQVKDKNYSKGIICTSAGFTRTAISFSENRPLELVGKDRLEQILAKANE